MSKDKISDYSTTANSNTDIGGINVDEGCAPSGINDAIRTLMAQLKTWQSGGQDVYIHPAGSASAPSITANGDTNTGIFFPAADTVGITTGGTERLRIDSAGDVGIGITPSAWYSQSKSLQVGTAGLFQRASAGNEIYMALNTYYDSTNTAKYVQNGGSSRIGMIDNVIYFENAASGTAGATASFSERMRLDASGNLGIGATSPTGKLNIINDSASNSDSSPTSWGMLVGRTTSNSESVGLRIKTGAGISGTTFPAQLISNGANLLEIFTAGASPVVFGTGATERARIDSSGNLLVGTTNSSDTTGVGLKIRQVSTQTQVSSVCSGSLNTYVLYNTAAGAYRFYVSEAGQIYATSTSITAISDQALKENIRDLETGLTEVMALQPRRFDWKNGDATNVAGFIAQEVEQVLPELVQDYVYSKDEEGNDITKKSLKMGDILPTLVKALQEMKAIIDDQAARIAALEAK